MFITIINDCRDENAKGRQTTRVQSLFGITPNFIGVEHDLEAAGCLIDTLDAGQDSNGIILLNVAPRSSRWKFALDKNGNGKAWENGTPFGYFKIDQVLVVATIDGFSLSLIKKLNLVREIKVLDVPQVLEFALNNNLLEEQRAERIKHTQFRSFDFVPYVANWLSQELELPYSTLSLTKIKDAPAAIWFQDNFGNKKTTLLEADLEHLESDKVKCALGKFKYYPRLKDVPEGEQGIITGSSGYQNQRFLEIVVQGGLRVSHS